MLLDIFGENDPTIAPAQFRLLLRDILASIELLSGLDFINRPSEDIGGIKASTRAMAILQLLVREIGPVQRLAPHTINENRPADACLSEPWRVLGRKVHVVRQLWR